MIKVDLVDVQTESLLGTISMPEVPKFGDQILFGSISVFVSDLPRRWTVLTTETRCEIQVMERKPEV